MGLIKHLLFWPVTGPEFLVKFSLGKVQDAVREELTDEGAVKEELLALQLRMEVGDIDDAEYLELEAVLMQRLRDVRRWKEEFGMGVAGGPVRVAREGPNVAEEVVASPPGTDDREVAEDAERPKGGIATPEGASVEVNFDWE